MSIIETSEILYGYPMDTLWIKITYNNYKKKSLEWIIYKQMK